MPENTPARRLCLASNSPRRRELLHQLYSGFITLNPDVDETELAQEAPVAYVERIACRKAEAGIRLLQMAQAGPHAVLAADTTVTIDGLILGKPASVDEAAAMLQRLSGRQHQVLTAVALAMDGRLDRRVSISTVEFKPLTDTEIDRYLAGNEAYDKAGAYAIQGTAGRWIPRIDGSYTGIVGLPLFETAALLAQFGLIEA